MKRGNQVEASLGFSYNNGMIVTIENRQRKMKLEKTRLAKMARFFSECAKVDLSEVTLIIVDDKGSAPINAAAVGHVGPTDVITIPYPAIPGDEDGPSAEIIINAECALKQRSEDPWRELLFYLAHAFNHLSGHDDDTPKKRSAMHRRERRWLARALNC